MANYTSTVTGITPSMSGSMSVNGSSYPNGTVSDVNNNGNSLNFKFHLNNNSTNFYRFVGALANNKYTGTCVLNGNALGSPIAADNWTAEGTGVGGKKPKPKAKTSARAKAKPKAKITASRIRGLLQILGIAPSNIAPPVAASAGTQ